MNKEDRLEDAIRAADTARTKIQVAAMQLAALGLKDSEAVARLRTASQVIKEARELLMAVRVG